MELVQSTLSASFIDKGPGNCCSICWGASNMASCCCGMALSVTALAWRAPICMPSWWCRIRPFYRRLLLGAASPPGDLGGGALDQPGSGGTGALAGPQSDPARFLERRLGWLSFPFNKVRHWLNRNTLTGSRPTSLPTTISEIPSIRGFSTAICSTRAPSIPMPRPLSKRAAGQAAHHLRAAGAGA